MHVLTHTHARTRIPIERAGPLACVELESACAGTTDPRHVRAKHVVVTVPVAVLRAGTITFQPELPAPKQLAIERLKMGSYRKASHVHTLVTSGMLLPHLSGQQVVLVFDSDNVFWPPEARFLHFAEPGTTDGTGDGSSATAAGYAKWDWFPLVVNYFAIKGVPVLLGVLVGHHASATNSMADDEGETRARVGMLRVLKASH